MPGAAGYPAGVVWHPVHPVRDPQRPCRGGDPEVCAGLLHPAVAAPLPRQTVLQSPQPGELPQQRQLPGLCQGRY